MFRHGSGILNYFSKVLNNNYNVIMNTTIHILQMVLIVLISREMRYDATEMQIYLESSQIISNLNITPLDLYQRHLL